MAIRRLFQILQWQNHMEKNLSSKNWCVLHVGKRMFRALKEVKKTLTEFKKFVKNQDGKLKAEELKNQKKPTKKVVQKVRGKWKSADKMAKSNTPVVKTTELTGKVMKKMSLYYGLAIQRHPNSVEAMKNEIWSSYFHMISTDAEPQHEKCNPEWCKYLQAVAEKKVFKHSPALSEQVQKYVEPVYQRLTADDLLTRCLGRNTQNNNECYNKSLWAIIPEQNFVCKNVVEIAAHISLSIFNEGRKTVLKMMELMEIAIGPLAAEITQYKDEQQIKLAEKRSAEATEDGRIEAKKIRLEEEKNFEKVEGLLYGPGIAG